MTVDDFTAILLPISCVLTAISGDEAKAAVSRGARKPRLKTRLLPPPAVTVGSLLRITVSHTTGESTLNRKHCDVKADYPQTV